MEWNELITYDVVAGTPYYIKITSYSGYSSTSPYLFRAKNYPGNIISDVPLYMQETTYTCNAACTRMILGTYGINISENDYLYYNATDTNSDGNLDMPEQYDYVYYIRDTINHFMSVNNSTVRYAYTNQYSSQDQYQEIIMENILNNHPVILGIGTPSNGQYLPYHSTGHYVVVKGIQYDFDQNCYVLVINDPHYDYCNTYYIPISVMYSYSQIGNGYIIFVIPDKQTRTDFSEEPQ